MVQRLPRGELRVIPGATHALNYSAAEALAKEIRHFLAELARTDAPAMVL